MPPIRFRSRHLHATITSYLSAALTTGPSGGWITNPTTVPANFGTQSVTIVDYQPDERATAIKTNTVAVSLGDFAHDEDEELGAARGGLRSALYPIFIDVYMGEQALALAICDDIRDIFTDQFTPLIDQVTGLAAPDTLIQFEPIIGPERGSGAPGSDQFRKFWRAMRQDCTLYFQS